MLTDGVVIMSGTLVPAIDQLYKDKKGAKKVTVLCGTSTV